MKRSLWILVLLSLAAFSVSASGASPKAVKVRIGHFPNITHAQALIMHATGSLEQRLGASSEIEWKVFNAGPSAIEAVFAGNMDIITVGPSPAINGYVKSNGEALRVVAGSSSGGAALVVQPDALIEKPDDFKGKKIASPQLGNTQDVALRSWLKASGLKLKEVGGDVQVVPLSNADIMTLFLKKDIDAAWTVEPWVTMLKEKAGAKVYLDEKDLWADGRYATALIVVRKRFLDERPAIVSAFLEEHVSITQRLFTDPAASQKIVRDEIQKETGKEFPEATFKQAFTGIEPVFDPMVLSVMEQARAAHAAGYLKKEPDLTGLFDLDLLEEVLQKRDLEPDWLKAVPRIEPPPVVETEAQK